MHLPKGKVIFLTKLNVYFEVRYASEHHVCKTGILESSKSAVSGGKTIYHLLTSLKYIIEEEELKCIFTSSALPGVHSAEVIYSSPHGEQNPSIGVKIELWAFLKKKIDLDETIYPEKTIHFKEFVNEFRNFIKVHILKF